MKKKMGTILLTLGVIMVVYYGAYDPMDEETAIVRFQTGNAAEALEARDRADSRYPSWYWLAGGLSLLGAGMVLRKGN